MVLGATGEFKSFSEWIDDTHGQKFGYTLSTPCENSTLTEGDAAWVRVRWSETALLTEKLQCIMASSFSLEPTCQCVPTCLPRVVLSNVPGVPTEGSCPPFVS